MARKKQRAGTMLEWLGLRDAPDWAAARVLGGLVTVVLSLLFVAALVAAVVLLGRTIAGGAGSLGTGALIVAVLSAPFLIWNTIIRQTTLNFQKEGHLTDRLAKAVEQLGAEKTVKSIPKDENGYPIPDKDGRPISQETTEPNLEVRIGGLLSLERIAQDSTAYDKGRDHVRVMEIICAYVRNNAPASDARNFPLGDLPELADNTTPEQRKEHLAYIKLRGCQGENLLDWSRTLRGPREDIMIALQIIERRSDKQRRIEAAHGRDGVVEADWPFAVRPDELPEPPRDGRHPKGAVADFRTKITEWRNDLRRYTGYRPDLRDTCLQGAVLSRFRLSGVRLDRARMEGADLSGARMKGADLSGVRMEGAALSGARMEGAILYGALMEGAILNWARMVGADLNRARMEGAILNWARMEGADLSGARMEGADLHGAWMDAETDLTAADFDGAAVRSTDYSSVAITQHQVNASFGDASVILPEGLIRPLHWPDWEMDWGTFYEHWRLWQSDPESYSPPDKPTP